jgi:hypothetical protein
MAVPDMVPKITTGNGIRGLAEYLLEGKKGLRSPRGQCIAGTLFGNARSIAAQVVPLRRLRPEAKNPIWHCSLNLPSTEGRKSQDWWETVAGEFLTEMGLNPACAGWVAVLHEDKEHQHIHLAVCRVLPDGRLWDRAHDVRRAIAACQVLEQRHELQVHDRSRPARRNATGAELQLKSKGKIMSREHIQNSVDKILADHPKGLTLTQLQAELARQRIEMRASVTQKGRLQGFSYKFDDVAWPGSKLGTSYSLGLQTRGLRVEAAELAQLARRDAADDRADQAEARAAKTAEIHQRIDKVERMHHAIDSDRDRKRDVEEHEAELEQSSRQSSGLAAALNQAVRRIGPAPQPPRLTPIGRELAKRTPELARFLMDLAAAAMMHGIELARKLMNWLSVMIRRMLGMPPGRTLVEINPPPQIVYRQGAEPPPRGFDKTIPILKAPDVEKAQTFIRQVHAKLTDGEEVKKITGPSTVEEWSDELMKAIHRVNAHRAERPLRRYHERAAAAARVQAIWTEFTTCVREDAGKYDYREVAQFNEPIKALTRQVENFARQPDEHLPTGSEWSGQFTPFDLHGPAFIQEDLARILKILNQVKRCQRRDYYVDDPDDFDNGHDGRHELDDDDSQASQAPRG